MTALFPVQFWHFSKAPVEWRRHKLREKESSITSLCVTFIFMLALHLLVRSLLKFYPIKFILQAMGTQASAAVQPSASMEVNHFSAAHINLILLIFILLLPCVSKKGFRKTSYNLVEFILFFLYVIGQYLLIATFIIPLSFIHPALLFLTFLAIFLYISWAASTFIGGKLVSRWCRSLFVTTFRFSLYILSAQALSFLIVTRLL